MRSLAKGEDQGEALPRRGTSCVSGSGFGALRHLFHHPNRRKRRRAPAARLTNAVSTPVQDAVSVSARCEVELGSALLAAVAGAAVEHAEGTNNRYTTVVADAATTASLLVHERALVPVLAGTPTRELTDAAQRPSSSPHCSSPFDHDPESSPQK